MKLNQHQIDRAPLPEPPSRQIFYWDDQMTGFGLCVRDTGARSFVLSKRIQGQTRRITLGTCPAMSLTEARAAYRAELVKIDGGANPAEDRAARRNEITLGDFIQGPYAERHAAARRSGKELLAILRRYVPSAWYGRRLSSIRRGEVHEEFDRVTVRSGPYAANHFVVLLKSVFNLAIDWEYLSEGTVNPAARIELNEKPSRKRFLHRAEFARWYAALQAEPHVDWRVYFEVILLLGPRRGELLTARWTDIDLLSPLANGGPMWTKPTTKNGEPHCVPLPPRAAALLRSLPSYGTAGWVFPGRGATGHRTNVERAWERIRTRAGLPDLRIHDLRRTTTSWLSGRGRNLQVLGGILNHRSLSATQVYARVETSAVREALDEMEAMVTELAAPTTMPLLTDSSSSNGGAA